MTEVDNHRNSWSYDAFISYSQKSDHEIAQDVRHELQTIATPFWKRRKSRVFLDSSSLSADPGMWDSLAETLDKSNFVVLLASERAAESKWVNRELRHFATQPHHETKLLLALTSGELEWDDEANDFTAGSTACPEALHGWFTSEPRYIDLREWREHSRRKRRRDARNDLASLAGQIRGVDKDKLIGDDIKLQRRNLALATVALVGLAVLAILATLFARSEAAQARRQEAQAVSALASAEVDERLDRALLLGVAGRSIDDTDGAQRGLFDVLARSAGVTRFIHPDGGVVRAMAANPTIDVIVTAGTEGTVTIWNGDWQQRHQPILIGSGEPIRDVHLDPTASHAYVATLGGVVAKIDIETGTISDQLSLPDSIRASALSPNGSTLYGAGTRRKVHVIDITEMSELPSIPMAFQRIDTLAISSANTYLAVGGRRDESRTGDPLVVLRLEDWSVIAQTRDPLEFYEGDSIDACRVDCLSSILSVAMDPQDETTLLFGSASGVVARWPFLSNEPPIVVGIHDDQVARVRFHPLGDRAASTGFDHDVRYWETDTWTQLGPARTHHGSRVWDMAFGVDDEVMTASDDEVVALASGDDWSSAMAHVVADNGDMFAMVRLRRHKGDQLAVARDDEIVIIDIATMKTQQTSQPLGATIWALEAGHRESVLFYALSNGEIGRWDLDSATVTASVRTENRASGLARHPHEDVLVTSGQLNGDLRVDFYAASSLDVIRSPMIFPDEIPTGIEFLDDGAELLVTGPEAESALWTWPGLDSLSLHLSATTNVHSVLDLEDQRMAIGADTQAVYLVDADGNPQTELPGHDNVVLSLAVAPDGSLLASGARDQRVILWDIGDRLAAYGPPLIGHTASVRAAEFSGDGERLFTLSRNELIAWNLDAEAWSARACEIANRSFGVDEWKRIVGSGIDPPMICEERR